MATEQQLTDKQLDILHDHYKETFARLREAEAMRDRLFLWVIGLFALLIVEIGYPAALGGLLVKLNIGGEELNLQSLPLPALLDATWILTLAISLRYCQTSVLVNRQYPYLHSLEKAISPAVGGGDLYQREGKVYLREYPLLLDVAWFAYGIFFPFILIGATIGLVASEYMRLPYSSLHIFFDVFIAVVLIIFLLLYRVQPAIASQWRKWRSRSSHSKQVLANTSIGSNEDTKPKKL